MSGDLVVLVSDIELTSTPGTHEIPLGPLAIGTVLAHAGYEVLIVDAQVDPDWRTTLTAALPAARLLGVSSLTGPSIGTALDALELARDVTPGLPTVWGGYHATLAYEAILREDLVDYVIRGYGEHAILALVGLLAAQGWPGAYRGPELADVPSLAWRDGDGLRANAMGPVPEPDHLPPLDYGLVDVGRYRQATGLWGDESVVVMPFVTSYGCPHACTFCAEPQHSQRRWRGLDPVRVADAVADLHHRYGAGRIAFADPDFTSNPHRVVAIVDELERRKLDVEIFADARARDVVVLERKLDLRRLRDAGFHHFYLGLESGSDRMLKKIRKGSTRRDAELASRALSGVGAQFISSFIHDFPTETDDDSEATIELAEEVAALPGNSQSHHFFMPYPMTQAFEELVAGSGLDLGSYSQRDWAATSTFWGSVVWPGRPEFRRRVVRELFSIHEQFPEALPKGLIPANVTYSKRASALAQRLARARAEQTPDDGTATVVTITPSAQG